MKHAVARELAVALLFATLSIAMTWPLAPNLDRAVSDPSDPFLNAWILNWDYVATFRDATPLFDAKIFHPARYGLAFSENLYGIALILFPFYAAGAAPIAAYNIALLLGFAFSGYGAYVLARLVTRSTIAGVLAGIFFAFMPFRFDHISHVQHVWSPWLPLMFAALVHYARRPTIARATLFGAAFLMNGLSNMHWLLFGGVAIVLTASLFTAADPNFRRWRVWMPLVVATVVSGLLLLPILLPYKRAAELYGFKRAKSEVSHYSARLDDWLVSPRLNRTYGDSRLAKEGMGERALFPGLGVLLLAGYGLFAARKSDFEERVEMSVKDERQPVRRVLRTLDVLIVLALLSGYYTAAAGKLHLTIGPLVLLRTTSSAWPFLIAGVLVVIRLWHRFPTVWGGGEGRSLRRLLAESRFPLPVWGAILWCAVGFLGSLGSNSFVHGSLYSSLEMFRSLRVPARWAMIAYAGLAVLAAVGVVAILRGRSRRARVLIASMAGVALLAELRAAPIRWHLADPNSPAVYRWLATAPISGAVFELPMDDAPLYLLRATEHHRPLVNGYSGFEPPIHAELFRRTTANPIDDRLLDRLREIGCSTLVVHDERLDAPRPVRDWIRRETVRERLLFLRRVDHGIGGDFVFAVRENEAAHERLREVRQRDGAGRTAEENLERFLANGRTYSGETFGFLTYPFYGEQVRGPLEISGWALSPSGVASIAIHLDNGKVTLYPERIEEPVVTKAYPWYPKTKLPGFRLVVGKRPPGVSVETDLDIEIIDGDGKRTRLDPVWIRWLPSARIDPQAWNRIELAALLRRMGYDADTTLREIDSGRATIQHLAKRKAEGVATLPNEEFIRIGFRVLLGRDVDPEGLAYHLSRLNAHAPRSALIEGIIGSDEFRAKYVTEE